MNKKSNYFNILTLLTLSVFLGVSLLTLNVDQPKASRLETQIEAYLEKEAFFLKGEVRSDFIAYLVATAKDYQFDPWLILAIMKVESSFKPHVVSNRGAIGLLQLKPIAAKEVAIQFDEKQAGRHELFNPFTNVKIGIQYLSFLRDQIGGGVTRILAAYNAGPTSIRNTGHVPTGYAGKVLKAYRAMAGKKTS